ncbi:hypothetical protein CPB85DRAFT_1304579 [Mucidula mucida]|nr:hypothetical protein CPB85DRAFT_1304579 [Mucidula mucida]
MSIHLNSLDRTNPYNHLASLLDIVELPDKEHVLLVTPYLRAVNRDPSFHCRQEVSDYANRFLSNLIHALTYSRSDICVSNILMDPTHVVPSGYHFARSVVRDGHQFKIIKTRKRCQVQLYNDMPELSLSVPHNPFKWTLENFQKFTLRRPRRLQSVFQDVMRSAPRG